MSVGGNVMTDAVTGDADTAPDSDPLTVTLAEQGGNPITPARRSSRPAVAC